MLIRGSAKVDLKGSFPPFEKNVQGNMEYMEYIVHGTENPNYSINMSTDLDHICDLTQIPLSRVI